MNPLSPEKILRNLDHGYFMTHQEQAEAAQYIRQLQQENLTLLAKPEQESISTNDHLCAMLRQVHDVLACTALPMKRPWVGLTDEDIEKGYETTGHYQTLRPQDRFAVFALARAIESRLKEKNNVI